jgi:hypothetical protein
MNKRRVICLAALLCGLGLALGAVIVLAQGAPAVDWWVFGGGGGPASGGNVAVNDTVGQPVIGPSGAATTTLGAGYWYGAVIDDEVYCGLTPGTYAFHPTHTVTVSVSTVGTIDCLRVQRVEEDHPNRIGEAGGSGVGWGRYWVISATNSTGGAASGYSATLVLPRDGAADPKVCRYAGGAGWDCVRDGFDGSSVWRAGITSFSDWAVGNPEREVYLPLVLRE